MSATCVYTESTRSPSKLSRQTKSLLASKSRRQRESSLIQEIGHTLPVTSLVPPDIKDKPLAKVDILKLTTSYLKFKQFLEYQVRPEHERVTDIARTAEMHEHALGEGFMLAMATDGTIIYTSRGTNRSLGLSTLELIGSSIYEWVHHLDYTAIGRLLESGNSGTILAKNERIRFKFSRMETNTFQLSGRLFQNGRGHGHVFVGIVQPTAAPALAHPADNRFPTFVWCNEQIFTTILTPDLKNAHYSAGCEMTMMRYSGFTTEEVMNMSCFEVIHPGDSAKFINAARILATTGESQEEFRCLRKYGGFFHVLCHSIFVDSRGRPTTHDPVGIICRNFVIKVVDTDEIVSEVQLCARTGAVGLNSDSQVFQVPEDMEGSITEISDRCCPWVEVPEVNSVADLIPSDEMEVLAEYLQIHTQSFENS